MSQPVRRHGNSDRKTLPIRGQRREFHLGHDRARWPMPHSARRSGAAAAGGRVCLIMVETPAN